MLAVVVTFAFLLWSIFHLQFEKAWSHDQAYIGDTQAQRHLASCYSTGCAGVPQDRAFACAWRQIIVSEAAGPSMRDISAERNVCNHLSALDQKWVPKLEADNSLQEIKDKRVQDKVRMGHSSILKKRPRDCL